MTNVLQLLTENKSINEIAKIINFSDKAINNYLKKFLVLDGLIII